MSKATYGLDQLEGFIDAACTEEAAQMNDVVEALGLRRTPQRRVTQAELEAATAQLPLITRIRGLTEKTLRPRDNPEFLLRTGGCRIAA